MDETLHLRIITAVKSWRKKAIKLKFWNVTHSVSRQLREGGCFSTWIQFQTKLFSRLRWLLWFLPYSTVNSLIPADYRMTKLMKSEPKSQVEEKRSGGREIIINIWNNSLPLPSPSAPLSEDIRSPAERALRSPSWFYRPIKRFAGESFCI